MEDVLQTLTMEVGSNAQICPFSLHWFKHADDDDEASAGEADGDGDSC